MSRARVRLGTFVVLAGLLALPGCTPWVQPYEREMLADPIMSPTRDPISARYRQHVYDVREAGRGATSTQGGGCGCN